MGYLHWSPFPFAMNCPISGIDLDGLEYYYTADGKLLGHETTDSKGNPIDEKISNSVKLATSVETVRAKGLCMQIYKGVQDLNISNDAFLKASSIIRQELGEMKNIDEATGIAHAFFNASEKNVSKLLSTLKIESSVGKASGDQDKIFSATDNSDGVRNSRAGLIHALSGKADPTNGATQFDGNDFLAWGTQYSPWGGGLHAKFREYSKITIGSDVYEKHLQNLLKLNPSGKVSWTKWDIINVPIAANVFLDKKNWEAGMFQYKTGFNRPKEIVATAAFGGSIFWKTK